MDREARSDWVLVILLFLAGLLAAGQFAKISLTLEALGRVYPGAGGALPFAVSTVSLIGVALGTTAGLIVARLGVRRVLLAAMAAGAGLSVLQALLPPFPVFMALRAVEGAAHLALVVAAPTLMAAVTAPRDTPVAMGLWGMFFAVGFAAAAVAVPPLLALGGPAAVFLAHGAALGGLAAILAPRLPRGTGRAVPEAGWLAMHRRIYTTPRLIAPALGFFWHTVTFIALLTYLPRFLGPPSAAVLPLVALIGTFGAGALARYIAPERVAMAAFALSVLTMPVLPLLPAPVAFWYALPLFVILGAVPGASFATVPALNPRPEDRARANGALAQLGNLGTGTATPLFAATLGLGLAGPAALATGLYLCGWIALWLIHRKIAVQGE